jgi:hypothetical protein
MAQGLPVIVVANYGLPVSAAAAPFGMAVTVSTSGYGMPVVPVAFGGRPVFDTSGTLFGPPVIPANTSPPVITGTTQVGQTLAVSVGTWSGTAATYTFQWKRGGVNISGATSSLYLLVTADLAAMITVTVTATNAAGSASATSAAVGPVTVVGGGAIATPTLTSLTTATDTGTSSTDNITSDTTPDINIDWGVDQPIENDVIEVRSNGVLVATHTVTALEVVMSIISLNTPLAEGSNSITVRHLRGADASSWSGALVIVIDTALPTLTAPGGVMLAATTATLSVTVNEASGTLYYVVTGSATPPTAAQIKLGQNNTGAAAIYAGSQAASPSGAKTATATGVTDGTRYAYYMQEDTAGNQSSVSSATWTQGVSTITWDPVRKHADIVLSPDKLTSSLAANKFYANLFGSGSGKSTGKYYFELTINSLNPDGQGVGFADGTVTTTELGGSGFTSAIWKFGTGEVMRSGVRATIQPAATGDICAVAIDFGVTPKRVWFRKKTGGTTGNWNNSGTADPATGVGGIDLGSPDALTGPFWPMLTMEINGDNFTANFGGSTYAMTRPTGFGNWS